MKQLYNIISLGIACLLASCSAEHEILPDNSQDSSKLLGKVEFTITGNNTRATTTTLSQKEAGEFWITIFKGGELSREKVQLKNLNSQLATGYGYMALAENCDENMAVIANEGWGQRRFYGSSNLFGIKIGETTKVGISCSVVNAGIEVVFDESVPQYFTKTYKVTVSDGERTIVFDSQTAGASRGEEITDGKTAYFNVSEDGTYTINYTIEAYGESIRLVKTRTLTLSKATISRMRLKFVPGIYDLEISVDNENIIIEQNIEISDKDITPDDGTTDIDSNHNSFEESEDEVDINDYN